MVRSTTALVLSLLLGGEMLTVQCWSGVRPWNANARRRPLVQTTARAGDGLYMTQQQLPEQESVDFADEQADATSIDAQFGQVVPLKRAADAAATTTTSSAFLQDETISSASSNTAAADDQELLQQRRDRNIGTAIVSILLAVLNYAWQWTHPVTPIQVLASMQASSAPPTIIGSNSKPTLVDFWAPWCENCKLSAPTLHQVEEEYADRVNFVMVNGDAPEAWPLIEAFGVDAIPHLALVSAQGDVETALIGPIPKHVLEADLDVLVSDGLKSSSENAEVAQQQPLQLPYTMLDVFATKPEQRRVHF